MMPKIVRKFTYSILLFFSIIFCLGACSENGSGKEGYKSINGTKIFYRIIGGGKPLLIIHGKPLLNHSYLVDPLKPLSKRHELVFFDQRLSGRSSVAVDKSAVTMQNFVDDIEELRKSLHLGKIDVMGHAWGGLLAMKYALKYPQNLNKIILSDPMPASAALWQRQEIALRARTTLAYRKAREQILSSESTRKMSAKTIKRLRLLSFSKQFHDSALVDSLDLYIPDDYAERSRLFGYMMPELRDFNLYSKLAGMKIPTLILFGSDEPLAQISGKKLNQTIPNSKLVIIKKSGHFPFIEQPDEFLSAVRSFLE